MSQLMDVGHSAVTWSQPSSNGCKLENVRGIVTGWRISVLAECRLKFKPRSKYDFFHRYLRLAQEKRRECGLLFYFILSKMERLAVKPILMRMGCFVFWIKISRVVCIADGLRNFRWHCYCGNCIHFQIILFI